MTINADVDFPRTQLVELISKYILSHNGQDRIVDSAEKIGTRWDALTSQWDSRHEEGNAAKLGQLLNSVAIAADNVDLAARDIPLRGTLGGEMNDLPDLTKDFNVCAKLMRVMVETLSHDETETIKIFQSIIASVKFPTIYDYAFVARLAAIDLYLEQGEFDSAIALAKTNLTFGCCSTSQFLLYKSLSTKKKFGQKVSETEICLDDLSDRFCSEPFKTLATGSSARKNAEPPFFACQCPGTLPYPVSNYKKGLNIESLWNGPEIQELRRSVLDGDYTYCSRMLCPALTTKSLPKKSEITDPELRDIIDNHKTVLSSPPAMLTLGHDPSCNIACPSCRNEIITIKNNTRDRLDKIADDILLPLMEGGKLSLIICTDGDPIGSKHYRRIIHNLDPVRHEHVRLMLITNGLLMTPREWDSLSHIHHLIAFVGVSIDAAQADTYEDLRRPGKWSTINANMDFLGQLRADGKLPHLGMQFVVQTKNFEQMADFVRMGQKWNADTIRFIRLTNIGSYANDAFEEHDVSDPRHPLYPRLMDILRDPIFSDPAVSMFTLTPLWEEANAALNEEKRLQEEANAALNERIRLQEEVDAALNENVRLQEEIDAVLNENARLQEEVDAFLAKEKELEAAAIFTFTLSAIKLSLASVSRR